MPARAPQPVLLRNAVVELTPLTADDAPDLFAALDDPRVWAAGYGGGPVGRPVDAAAMRGYVTGHLLGAADRVSWAVRLRDGRLVGTSSLGDVDLANESAHLGWTAYAPAVWGTAVNPATKLAILTHAFDDCGLGRVRLQTDVLNARSQAAIARLGAVREGVLRRHKRRADGTFRDTVVFSILADEWPQVRAGLEARTVGVSDERDAANVSPAHPGRDVSA
ncbi:GNAT family N-acetyltransferase [Georgenia sp. EYE_87]|uniref:GNAT family N-acetyltransferase n=1 Tax=Georgenia sp. EYE_87 TaxID=2853448 RepID=UPI002005EE6B|nr:GNAT family protein [Georgenia sp. EYE_87]MCK6210214.1 GNAT family N-acetyltransferase [Georgenia sp. EYE_87]